MELALQLNDVLETFRSYGAMFQTFKQLIKKLSLM